LIGIYDNFLEKSDFERLKETLMSTWFQWYYNDSVVRHMKGEEENPLEYQFTHMFYKDNRPYSDFFNVADLVNAGIQKRLNREITLIRIKANFRPISHKITASDYHQDCIFLSDQLRVWLDGDKEQYLGKNGEKEKIVTDLKHYTAIFYVNSNNGYTELMSGKTVDSIENRLFVFDANEVHTGTTSTDDHRIVINYNFF